MIRGHVILSLYFLVGMIGIVDLYIACVYANNYFEKLEKNQGSGKDLDEGVKGTVNSKTYRGFGTDYGFDLKKSPPEAFEFPYELSPAEDSTQLNISAPALRLMEDSISPHAIMNYVSHRILDYHNFMKARVNGRLSYFGHIENIPKSGYRGTMWVKKEVVESMQLQYSISF